MGEAADANALARLTEVSHALTYAATLEEVLDITVECAIDLLGAERAVLMLQDDPGMLRIRAYRGLPAELVEQFREPLDERLVGRLSGLLGPDAEPRFLGVPLVVRGGVMGLLAVLRPAHSDTSDRDEWLLSALADQAAVALEGARGERDRTDLQEQVRSLEEASGQREDALRMVTHDLRSPLSALNGYLHLLDAGLYGPLNEEQHGAIRRLQAVSRHLQGLVGNVVEMGQLATGTLRLECKPVGLDVVVSEAVAMVDLKAEDGGIRIQVDVPTDARVLAEPDRLRQVLVHLLENAVQYAPEGTSISVSGRTEPDGEMMTIQVADQGPGIPPEQVEAIFEPYRQLEPGSKAGGLGLGLAIARSLVVLMDGSLRADPEATDGAIFEIQLPVAARSE